MIAHLSRAELLSRSARTGAALLVAGTALGPLASSAAADVFDDNDLSYLRLLVGTELLGIDFYTTAIGAKHLGAVGTRYLKQALLNEKEHYRSLARAMTESNAVPATADDVDFAYPERTFTSAAEIVKAAARLETTFVGAYLGAVDAVHANSLKQPLAKIAANQAQHLATFTQMLGRSPFALSFPASLAIEQASNALAAYTS